MTILCYHEVAPGWKSPLCVTPAAFSRHLDWLMRHRTVLSLPAAEQALTRDQRLPSSCTAITFDDGCRGLYDHAFPLLKSAGVPATIFLVADAVANSERPIGWYDAADLAPTDVVYSLTPDQVLEMHEEGVTFGAHGYTHLDLTALSVKECTADLKMSREYLEDLLGEPVTRLAYPRGCHNASVREAARRAGFLASYALPISREPGGMMAIPRVGVYARNGTWAVRIKSSKRYLDMRTHPVIGRFGARSWRTEPALLDDPRPTL